MTTISADTARRPAHHFDDIVQQREAVTLGMWIFLVTEVMFFGGMFTAYAVYRTRYPHAFAEGGHHLDLVLGTINTGVLLLSSFTVVLAVHAAQTARRNAIALFLALTVLLGLVFLGIKSYEYWSKFTERHVPGARFEYHPTIYPDVDPGHVEIFYSLYFAMTGVHAAHMIIGVGLFTIVLVLALKGRITPDRYDAVEISGLYWHFVDIVWVFLFPLLYLVA